MLDVNLSATYYVFVTYFSIRLFQHSRHNGLIARRRDNKMQCSTSSVLYLRSLWAFVFWGYIRFSWQWWDSLTSKNMNFTLCTYSYTQFISSCMGYQKPCVSMLFLIYNWTDTCFSCSKQQNLASLECCN